MVFSATFNNISVISWRSVLMVEETGENDRPASCHWQTRKNRKCKIAAVWNKKNVLIFIDNSIFSLRNIQL
jgi:hypothetical protein